MRQKIDTVVRLQNTIRYSEKVRQEWEERVEQAIAEYEGGEHEYDEDAEQESDGQDDHSSTPLSMPSTETSLPLIRLL